uniref:G-protein coupled receptors family 1 profile domain-containing protein n=1 Tax=Romanomermis culicivorax TaxID=13658 RepID=A0A915JY56_ROMCU
MGNTIEIAYTKPLQRKAEKLNKIEKIVTVNRLVQYLKNSTISHCISYYSSMPDLYAKIILVVSTAIRVMGILTSFSLLIYMKWINPRFKNDRIVDRSPNLQRQLGMVAKIQKLQQPLLTYVFLVVWFNVLIGSPYTLIRQFTFYIQSSDLSYLWQWTISIVIDSLDGIVLPSIVLLKNRKVRRAIFGRIFDPNQVADNQINNAGSSYIPTVAVKKCGYSKFINRKTTRILLIFNLSWVNGTEGRTPQKSCFKKCPYHMNLTRSDLI